MMRKDGHINTGLDRAMYLCLGVGLALAAMSGIMPGPATGSQPVFKLDLKSVYLTNAVAGAHTITLKSALGRKGKLILDGNACSLNRLGDIVFCTMMYFKPIDVALKPVAVAGLNRQRRRLYRLEGRHLPEGAVFFLALARGKALNPRLIVETGGSTRVVLLQRQ